MMGLFPTARTVRPLPCKVPVIHPLVTESIVELLARPQVFPHNASERPISFRARASRWVRSIWTALKSF
jgi:hypothetical protein